MKLNYWYELCLEILSDYTKMNQFSRLNSVVFLELRQHIDNIIILSESMPQKKCIYINIEQLLWWTGKCGSVMGQYHYALNQLLRCYRLRKQFLDDEMNTDICANISNIYSIIGNVEEANKWLAEADVNACNKYSMNGAIYFRSGDLNRALQEYLCALPLCINKRDKIAVLNNIIGIHLLMGNRNQAIQCLVQVQELLKHVELPTNEKLTILSIIAKSYMEFGEFETALQYNREILKERRAFYIIDHPEIARTYQNIGTIYAKMGKKDLALENWKMAGKMFIALSTKDSSDIKMCISSICNYLLLYGNEQEKEAVLKEIGFRD